MGGKEEGGEVEKVEKGGEERGGGRGAGRVAGAERELREVFGFAPVRRGGVEVKRGKRGGEGEQVQEAAMSTLCLFPLPPPSPHHLDCLGLS